ncbi:CehA/McbA family metallohydrolase [Pseudactinotalea suaedae]|uniref:CehA/McbA family metallohydrolase n=1 Tax=Pseudactinotalea suaedae TaxID=1524924 RepID=UPI0012E2FABB|nr:CehA/McbA family metallohydrolase [Pseudactinotalea suaedae]
MTVVLDRVLGYDDIEAGGRFLSVPFDVPAGTSSFEVRLSFDESVAIIDLGCSGPDGWRGWSGGARRRFVVGTERSTWGYLAGPIEPGTWHVVLGLHAIPAEGVHAVVRVETPGPAIGPEPPAPAPVGPMRRRRDLSHLGGTWLAGEMHAHTLHSDGRLTPAQLVGMAARNGLDFIAVTDHNTISHHADLPELGERYGILTVPGQEVTTRLGHANAYGDVGWVDFREHPDTWMDQVDAAGGALAVNHPVAGDCSWQWNLRRPPHAVEIGHSSLGGDRMDQSPWAWLRATGWSPGHIGGGDYHGRGGAEPGTCVTWVDAEEPTTAGVLGAVRAGRTAFGVGVEGPVVLRIGEEIVTDGAAGLVLTEPDGSSRMIRSDSARFPAGEGPYRLETDGRLIVAGCG